MTVNVNFNPNEPKDWSLVAKGKSGSITVVNSDGTPSDRLPLLSRQGGSSGTTDGNDSGSNGGSTTGGDTADGGNEGGEPFSQTGVCYFTNEDGETC